MSQAINSEQLLELLYRETQLAIPAEQAMTMTMAELHIDSLALVEIAMMLEQELDIDLDLDFIDAATTLEELLNGILAAS